MKTFYNIIKKTILATTLLGSVLVYASEAFINPKTPQEVVDSLSSQSLTREQILADNPSEIVSDLNVRQYYFRNETIETDRGSFNIQDLLDDYSTSTKKIEDVLKTRFDYQGFGQRLNYMIGEEQTILDSAEINVSEQLLIYTIQRNIDLVNHVISFSGENHDELARWFSNLTVMHLELAAGFANNKRVINNVFHVHAKTEATDLVVLHSADFGFMYATLLWNFSKNLTSSESKAIILMKLLGYLGWDLNSDLRRRSKTIAPSIVDIYKAQNSQSYQNIVKRFQMGKKPLSEDVARLRKTVSAILSELSSQMEKRN